MTRTPKNPDGPKANVKEIIIEQVLAALEVGKVAWHRPWRSSNGIGNNALPVNIASKKRYTGSNVWLLGMEQMGDPSYLNVWGTWKQINEAGGKVRDDQTKAYTKIIFYSTFEKEVAQPNGDTKAKKFASLRYYRVYNIAQADWANGYPKWVQARLDATEGTEHLDAYPVAQGVLDAYVGSQVGLQFREDPSDTACYRPASDVIAVPQRSQFDSLAEWYSTAFHEATHSTGHKLRCDRPGIVDFDHFGSHQYSVEELVAEMGAAMLSGSTDVDCVKARDNSVAYLAHWGQKLKADPDIFFQAASQAEKAQTFILQWSEEVPEVEDEVA
jgi:antirestriction protein ArdC